MTVKTSRGSSYSSKFEHELGVCDLFWCPYIHLSFSFWVFRELRDFLRKACFVTILKYRQRAVKWTKSRPRKSDPHLSSWDLHFKTLPENTGILRARIKIKPFAMWTDSPFPRNAGLPLVLCQAPRGKQRVAIPSWTWLCRLSAWICTPLVALPSARILSCTFLWTQWLKANELQGNVFRYWKGTTIYINITL